MAGKGVDWMFVADLSSQKAEEKLDAFAKKAKTILNTIPGVEIKVNTAKALEDVDKLTRQSIRSLNMIKDTTLRINSAKALQDIQSFSRAASAVTNKPYTATVNANVQGALTNIAQVKSALSSVTGSVRTGVTASGSRGVSGGASTLSSVTREVESQTKAVDFLTKAWGYSMLKLMEYEVIAKSVEGAIHGVANSLKEASDIQFEQTMQRMYSPSTFSSVDKQNQALTYATDIAKQWGSNITDVLQVQGLWTKQTNDLASATFLADKAEQLHRASGVDTVEVYEKSIAMASQLGITLDQLPKIYDQIAEAALKVAVPMNNFGGQSGRREAMKDLLEGSAKGMATFKSMGMTDKNDAAAGSIAIVANQLQATGDGAKEAAKNLTSMFAALEGGGPHRRAIEAILGDPSQFKSFDEVIQKFIDKAPELRQALANGSLGVRPAQVESMQTYLGSLKEILKLHDDIVKNSQGKLGSIAQAEMETLKGQVDRTKASAQQFGIALGTQVLPDAMQFLHFLNESIPLLSQHASSLASLGRIAFTLGEAYLGVQIAQKAWNSGFTAFEKMSSEMSAVARAQSEVTITNGQALIAHQNLTQMYGKQAAAAGALRIAQAGNISSMQAEMEQMEKEKAVIADLARQKELLAWRTGEAEKAARSLGTTEQAVADIALASRSKFAVMAEGIGMIGTAALAQIGPIALMAAAIQGLDALDRDKNAQFGLSAAFQHQGNISGDHTRDELITNVLHSPQIGLAYGLGRGGEFDRDLHYEQDIIKNGQGFLAQDVRTQYKTRQTALEKGRMVDQQQKAYEEQFNPNTPAGLARQLGMTTDQQLARQNMESVFAEKKKKLQAAYDQASVQEARSIYGILEAHKNKTSPEAREMEAIQKAAEARLKQTSTGEQTQPLPPAQPAPDKTMATPEAINRNQMEAVKRDAMAAMTVAQDLAEAGKMNEETVKKQAQLHGWSAKGIADLNAAYKEQIEAIGQKSAAANQEVYDLKRSEQAALALEASLKKGSKAQIEAGKTADMAKDAWHKAVALQKTLKASIEETRAAQELANQSAQVAVELADGDKMGPPAWLKTGAPHTLEEFRALGGEAVRKVDEARKGGGLSGEAAELARQSVILADAHKKLNKVVWEHPNDAGALAAFKALKEAEIELQGKTEELPKEFNKLFQSIQRIGQKSALKNADDAAEALGMDKRTINAVKDYIEQLNSIQDEREQLKDRLRDIGTGDSPEANNARNMVYWSQQQLDIQEKMLPVIEQHKLLEDEIAKIRKSAEYTSLDKSLNREGDNLLNQIIKRDFTESSHPTFGTQYGGRPTKSGGVLSGFLQDYTQTAGGDAIKSVSGHLLDGIFPVDKLKAQEQTNRDELKHIYTVAVSGQLTAAQMYSDAVDRQLGISNSGGIDVTNQHGILGMSSTTSIPEAWKGMIGGALANSPVFATISKDIKTTALNTDVNGNPSGLAAQYVAKMDEVTDKNPLGTFGAKGGFFGASKGAKGGQNFTLGNIMAGTTEGAAASAAFGTSGPWGSILGGVGGAFGPVGAAVGSIIGGLIGPHYNATKNPDMFNPAYGQWLSNMSGTQNMVNGTPVDPTKQFNTYLGYQSQSQQMASYVNSAQMIAELPPALKQFAQNIKNLENASGGGLGIRSEHNGMITLDSGKTVSVEDYMKWTNELQNYKDQMANVPIAPLISMNAYGGNGMNPGGGKGYSTIGLTAQEVNALQLTAYGTKLNPSQAGPVGVAQPQYQASPYATPFTGAALGSSASQPIYVTSTGTAQQTLQTINLVVDSKVLASVVNAQNNQTLNAAGKIAA